jgi:uncharacterized membrane protein YGL010W
MWDNVIVIHVYVIIVIIIDASCLIKRAKLRLHNASGGLKILFLI